MLYFDSIPNILTPDGKGNLILLKNLMSRSEIITSLLNNPMLFYTYDIKEDDTPEIIAHKYYGDSYRYWIVLFANKIIDPQWDWPLTSNQFVKYLHSKYDVDANSHSMDTHTYTNSTIKEYRKHIKTVDNLTTKETIETIIVDATAYANISLISNTYVLPHGSVTKSVSKEQITIYDYENEKNESRRNINLINSIYVSQLEQQIKILMSS